MAANLETELIAQAWAALSLDASRTQSPPVHLEITGASGQLVSRFPVEETAVACVGTALLAAAALHQQRSGISDRVTLDRSHVAAAVRSERYFHRDGRSAGAGFAPLSRFWRTADGWVRTHANYPWHRAALIDTLATSEDAGAVASTLAGLPAEEVEERVCAAGGIAAAVRPLEAWRDHPQGQALAREGLIDHQVAGEATPRRRSVADLPAADVRVLDLTRVIAGPVCTRFLGALGADVLRVDPPGHPDMAHGMVADTLLGKRSSMLDLNFRLGVATLHDLLDRADVVVCGYRAGALDRFGLGATVLAERHPGLVILYLNAWGHSGPWAGRRGFDSVVQAPTGIALGESHSDEQPGALPCQLLDHGTGYLAAAAVLDGLRRQGDLGGTHIRRVSLARTASWLTSITTRGHGTPASPAEDAESAPWLVDLTSTRGPVTVVAPPGSIRERPLRWPRPLTGYGDDPPTWSPA